MATTVSPENSADSWKVRVVFEECNLRGLEREKTYEPLLWDFTIGSWNQRPVNKRRNGRRRKVDQQFLLKSRPLYIKPPWFVFCSNRLAHDLRVGDMVKCVGSLTVNPV